MLFTQIHLFRYGISFLFCAALACTGAEAPVVQVPVVVDSQGMQPVTTDLGYAITITRFRAAIRDIEFSTGGETHAAPLLPASRGDLYHPGHAAGGDITGELRGAWIVDWLDDGTPVGTAELIVGHYQAANFTFDRGGEEHGLSADDAIWGHTFHIEGGVDSGAGERTFRALVDVDLDAYMVGALFDVEITQEALTPLALQALTLDPFEGDTLFDGIDFDALPVMNQGDGHIDIVPGDDAHNILRRNVQVHDHYAVIRNQESYNE